MSVTTNRPGEQLKTRAKLRKLRYAAREALAAVAELEAATEIDVWGRYELAPGLPLDADDLAGWLELARQEYEGMTVELLAVVRMQDLPQR